MSTTTIYTTAPKDYDFGWTQEVSAEYGRFLVSKQDDDWLTVRKVEVFSEHVEPQMMRYGSGLYMVRDEAEWSAEVEAGYAVVNAKPRVALDLRHGVKWTVVYIFHTEDDAAANLRRDEIAKFRGQGDAVAFANDLAKRPGLQDAYLIVVS